MNNKVRKFIKIFIVLYLFFLTSLVSAWAVFHIYEGNGKRLGHTLTKCLLSFVQIPGKVNDFILNIRNGDFRMPPKGLLVKNDTLTNGFTIYDSSYKVSDKINLLVSTYNLSDKTSIIKLLDLHQLTTHRKWVVNVDGSPATDQDLFFKLSSILQHPVVVNDGHIMTHNHQYLYKIDSEGKVTWKKKINIHHSIEKDSDDNLWVCSSVENKKDYPFLIKEKVPKDMIVKIDYKDGKILFQKSIFDILVENGYQYVLTIGNFEMDLLHLNDIQPALYSTKYWAKGDLLISLRNRNAVFLYRPSQNKIIWMKIGPWSNQHDCDFVGDNQILVFGNDVLRSRGTYSLINGYNNAYIYNFETQETTTPYDKFFKSLNIATPTEGRCDLLPDAHLLVEETENGRILIGDSNTVKIIYVEREDKRKIQSFNWCRIVNDDEIHNLK